MCNVHMYKPFFRSFHFYLNRFIRLEYEPVFGLENIAKRFNEASHDTTNHFVEGLQYSLDEAVIMTGVMVPDHEVDHRNVVVQKLTFLKKKKTQNEHCFFSSSSD